MHRKYFHFRVNERRYEFGDSDGANDWVCAKIPNDGRIKKDCIPKVYCYSFCVGIQLDMFREMPQAGMCICWKTETSRCNEINRIYQIFVLLIALKFSPCQGCNGGVCYCDDRDACNKGSSFVPSFLPVAMFSLLFAYLQ